MLTNCQCDSALHANGLNFAINNLDYNKVKASTITLHVTKHKTTLCINYTFQKIARYNGVGKFLKPTFYYCNVV